MTASGTLSPNSAYAVGHLRTVIAVLLLISGGIHLRLYHDGYRDVPDIRLGRSFLLDAIAAGLLAVAVMVWRNRLTLLAAAALSVGSLAAFALSRTDQGIFGFSESGLQPSPEATVALIAEMAALAVIVWLLVRGERMMLAESP